jgi:hypothetical protein
MKGVIMAVNPQANLPTALDTALGAITATRQGVKQAAQAIYNPPADQTPPVPEQPAPAPKGP